MAIKGAYSFEFNPLARAIDALVDYVRHSFSPHPGAVACERDLCTSEPPALNAEAAAWLRRETGITYQSVLAGTAGDGELGLVRADGRIDRLRLHGCSLVLNTTADACMLDRDAVAAPLVLTPRDRIFSDIVGSDRDQRFLPIHRSHSVSSLSDKDVLGLVHALSPEMRRAVRAVDATERPARGWELSSLGIIEVGPRYDHADFYGNAARALTVELASGGMRIIEEWSRLQMSDGDAADEIALTTEHFYAHPDEVRKRAAIDPAFSAKADLLLRYGFITRVQRSSLEDQRVSLR